MSFLSKFGQVIAGAAATAAGVAPLFPGLFGSAAKVDKAGAVINSTLNDLTNVAGVIAQIEVALAGKTSPEKFGAAVNLVGPIIRTSQLVSGKKIADEQLMQKAILEVTQGVVDILNSLHQDSVKTS